jgi:hypothetical protein
MNLHPSILNLAGLVDKRRSRKELAHMVSLIEEQSSVLAEREKLRQVASSRNSRRGPPDDSQASNSPTVRRPVKCWGCGRLGYIRSSCFRKGEECANRKVLSGFRKVVAVPADASLWITVELKSGKVPALLDTGAQFSCIRSDVAEFLYLTGERCSFSACLVNYVLADGSNQRNEVTRKVIGVFMGSRIQGP